jgi:hypothetical protein
MTGLGMPLTIFENLRVGFEFFSSYLYLKGWGQAMTGQYLPVFERLEVCR